MRSQKLSDSLSRIKKPTHILGTTYTLSLAFFESEIFPIFNKSNLKSCTIIADRKGYFNSLREGSALLEAGEGYLITSVPNSIRTFHPKVWLVVSEDELLLLVGSGNLTQSGFMTNAEVFDEYYCTKDTGSSEIISDILGFLSGLESMWEDSDGKRILCVEFLKEIKESVEVFANLKSSSADMRFLHTFDGPLLDQLPELSDPVRLYISSPFFGRSSKGIELFETRYPGSKKMIFPAEHSGGEIDIDINKLRSIFPEIEINMLKTWAKPDAFAHLKIYAAFSENSKGWFFCTSANCTLSAWNGGNVEAGLLREISNSKFLKFFQVSDQSLPSTLRKEEKDDNTSTLSFPIWSTMDSFNSSFSLHIPSCNYEQMPLRNVEIRVSCGGERSVINKNSLEFINQKESFTWKDFDLKVDNFRGTHCLMISGQTKTGEKIVGECFMENVGRLSLDPFHRRAWRGAESLLEDEDFCEHGDISKLYLLLEKGMEEDPIGAKGYRAEPRKDKKVKKFSDSIAIWPPIPSEERNQALNEIGSIALGRLDLFNKIVRLLLSEEVSPSKDSLDGNKFANELLVDDDSDDDYEVREKLRIKHQEEADRLWNSAYRRYESFLDKLKVWVPNEKKVKNFWTSATMILLITLKTNKRARKKESKSAIKITIDELIRIFFKSVFYGTNGSIPLSRVLLNQFDARPPSICVPFLMPFIVNERFNRRNEAVPQSQRFGARQVDAIISDRNELTPELLSKSWENLKSLINHTDKSEVAQFAITESEFKETYKELRDDYFDRK